MKISALALLLLFGSSFAHTADTDQKRKPSEATAGAKKGNIAYATVPFDVSVEKLPASYQGHSILDILKKLSPLRPKGEFEKSEEYESRLTHWKETPFLGNLVPTDVLAFEISGFLAPDALSVKYDADREEMTATISFENQYFDSGTARWLETFYQSKNLGSHIGTTRMGIKFRITSHVGTSVGLGVKEQIQSIKISKQLPRDEALSIKIKSNIKA